MKSVDLFLFAVVVGAICHVNANEGKWYITD